MDEKLKTILANIQSLVDQANQLSGVEKAHEEPDGDEGVAGGGDGDGGEMNVEEIMKILKGLNLKGAADAVAGEKKPVEKNDDKDEDDKVEKSDEGTHGDDSAEDIIEDQGEVNLKNIQEVAKAVAKIYKSQKSAAKSVDPSVKKSLDNLASENRELKKSLELLLEGFGIAKTIKESTEVKKSQDAAKKPEDLSTIKKAIAEEVVSLMKPEQKQNGVGWGMDTMNSGSSSVRKSISDGISNLVPTRN